MSFQLDIFKDDEKVNTITSNNEQDVKNELLKVFYSKQFYNTKTKISKQYDIIKITQTFAESFGTYKYQYTFVNVEI